MDLQKRIDAPTPKNWGRIIFICGFILIFFTPVGDILASQGVEVPPLVSAALSYTVTVLGGIIAYAQQKVATGE